MANDPHIITGQSMRVQYYEPIENTWSSQGRPSPELRPPPPPPPISGTYAERLVIRAQQMKERTDGE